MPSTPKLTITRVPGTYDLVFDPPKGTDEHSDALEAAYPNKKTLIERRTQAVIEFYLREKEEAARRSSSVSLPYSQRPILPSSQDSTTSRSSHIGASSDSSPCPSGVVRVQSNLQLKPRLPTRKLSSTAKNQQPAVTSGIDAHLHTFRLTEEALPKSRVKKPKTKEQLDGYRIRKLLGACDYHKLRKRKVTMMWNSKQNQADAISVLSIVKSGNKTFHSIPSG
jgi:hypothetical protein